MQGIIFRHRPSCLAVLAALAALSGTAAADTETQLGEMVIQGDKAPSIPRNLPAVSEGITAAQMDEAINVVNTEDALKYMPSLQIRKRFIGDTNGIVASRSSGTLVSARSLVYADNLLLSNLLGNSFAYPPRWGLVTPEEIERIDVIYGPFSAEYPGNAMGAVIAMTTRMPEKFEAHARTQAFRQNYKIYGTEESYGGYQASAALGSRAGALSWWASFNHLDSEGQPMAFATKAQSTTPAGGGDPVVSGARVDRDANGAQRVVLGATSVTRTIQDHAKLKLAYDFTPQLQATYTLGWWQNDSESKSVSYLRDAAGNPVYSGNNLNIGGFRYTIGNTDISRSVGEQEHWLHGLSLKTKTRGEWDWEVAASLYDYGTDITRAPTVALPAAAVGGAGRITDMSGTGWHTLDLRGQWRPGLAQGAHEFSFGYHYDRYELDTRVFDTANWLTGRAGARRSAFAGKTSTQALYAQDAWKFARDWKLTLGGRLERWQAYDGSISNQTTTLGYGERKETFFSPKAALSFQASPLWALRASLGRAYRMPTVAELYQGSINVNTIVNNDPNLKPERALSGELTAERDLGNGLLRISLFQENADDALYSQTNVTVTPNVTNIQNIDRIRTRGIELAYQAVDVGIAGLDLNGSVTYADSEIVENDKAPATVGKRQPRVPRWRATLAATWRPSDRLSWTLAARYSGRQYNTLTNTDSHPDTYGGVSEFFVVDARMQYKVAKQWKAAIGIDNLNNRRYYVAHPYPQRTVVAELKFDY